VVECVQDRNMCASEVETSMCVIKELDFVHSINRSGARHPDGSAPSCTMWSVCWCAQLFDLIFVA
jgi:hypothetical protein